MKAVVDTVVFFRAMFGTRVDTHAKRVADLVIEQRIQTFSSDIFLGEISRKILSDQRLRTFLKIRSILEKVVHHTFLEMNINSLFHYIWAECGRLKINRRSSHPMSDQTGNAVLWVNKMLLNQWTACSSAHSILSCPQYCGKNRKSLK